MNTINLSNNAIELRRVLKFKSAYMSNMFTTSVHVSINEMTAIVTAVSPVWTEDTESWGELKGFGRLWDRVIT